MLLPNGILKVKGVLNSSRQNNAYMLQRTTHHWIRKWFVGHQAMIYMNKCQIIANLTSENLVKYQTKYNNFHSRNKWKCLRNGGRFVSASVC